MTEAERKASVDEAIERLDKLAEGELEMARMFRERGKFDTARRRLQNLIAQYNKSRVADAARQLLQELDGAIKVPSHQSVQTR